MQFGILFDAQKLGSGFYGYTAFRILFTVAPPSSLAGCTLLHGEVGEGRSRPYCIAIESNDRDLLHRIKSAFAQSMVRGLMPLAERFADEAALRDEVLAVAARIDLRGQMADCQSRWLHDAWQRATGQQQSTALEPVRPNPVPAPPPQKQAVAQPVAAQPAPYSRGVPKLPSKVPLLLRIGPPGRSAIAWMLAACAGGALVPWYGWPAAVTAMILSLGLVHAFLVRLRLWAEQRISGAQTVAGLAKALKSKPPAEVVASMGSAGPLASPLVRRIHAITGSYLRTGDLGGACILADQFTGADEDNFAADLADLRTYTWAALAVPGCILAGLHAFFGPPVSGPETPRLVLMAGIAWTILSGSANLIAIAFHRAEARYQRLLGGVWIPAMLASQPAQAVRTEPAGDQKARDTELIKTVAALQGTIDQLTPILASFREPFVLQAVPVSASRPKAVSAAAS